MHAGLSGQVCWVPKFKIPIGPKLKKSHLDFFANTIASAKRVLVFRWYSDFAWRACCCPSVMSYHLVPDFNNYHGSIV
jgi:hypothetical protein